jgi:hypothetical protein
LTTTDTQTSAMITGEKTKVVLTTMVADLWLSTSATQSLKINRIVKLTYAEFKIQLDLLIRIFSLASNSNIKT